MMLKFVPVQRGCSWARAWQEHRHRQQHGDREGSDTAATQHCTGSLSAALSCAGCELCDGWQAGGGGMSPWVTGSSSQVLQELLVLWEMLLPECQLQTSHLPAPIHRLGFELRWKI